MAKPNFLIIWGDDIGELICFATLEVAVGCPEGQQHARFLG
jgi:hypothetical protein